MNKIVLILSAILFTLSGTTALAQTATPSGTATTSADQVTIIRNIVQQNLATAEAMYRKASLVGFVGKISAISNQSFSLKMNGDTYQVKTTDKTTYSKNGVAKFTSLAIGDKAIVIGTTTSKDILDSKRVVVIKDTPSELSSVASGKIVSVNSKTRSLVLRVGNIDQVFILSRKANIKIETLAAGKSLIAVYELQEEDQVITTAKVSTPTP